MWRATLLTVVAGLILVGCGSGPELTWTEVVAQLEEVDSLSGWATVEERLASGKVSRTHFRAYQKDGGYTRTALFVSGASDGSENERGGEPQTVLISIAKADSMTSVALDPKTMLGRRSVTRYEGAYREHPPHGQTPERAATAWLAGLAGQGIKPSGQGELDGRPVIVFETLQATVIPGGTTSEGTVKVWVDKQGLPVVVETQYDDARGASVSTRMEELSWQTLKTDLFERPEDEGYEISSSESVQYGWLPPAPLSPAVKLAMGPKDAEPIVTEQDVLGVSSASWMVDPGTQEPAGLSVALLLSPEAAARMVGFTTEHMGEAVSFLLNGQPVGEPVVKGVVRDELAVSLAPLGIGREEFEEQYLQVE